MEGLWNGPPDLDGRVADEHWIEVESGVSIRVLVWDEEGVEPDSGTVVMVPGWGSLFEGWRPLVTEWVKSRHLIYIETREKASSKFERRISKDDFSIERHSKDIATVLEALDVDQENIDWYSSSLGSTLLIDAFEKGDLGGRSSVLLAPNPDFKFPLWSRMIIYSPLPMVAFRKMVGFVAWVVNRRTKEEGQKVRYRRALLAQDVQRMLLSARWNLGYSLPRDLSKIEVPCAVMTAASDTLHDFDKVERIADSIPDCRMIKVPSNQYAHEPDVLSEIGDFHSSLT
ncbi:MAG: alpha/beta hydrolase [Candidatus Thalassarchaeaceae archaeon]|nr:alpha/beta hydrolase [Candidatus Thalassarchaeaceae archaeon]